ncbi:unnamed protein product [Lampetra planeri]
MEARQTTLTDLTDRTRDKGLLLAKILAQAGSTRDKAQHDSVARPSAVVAAAMGPQLSLPLKNWPHISMSYAAKEARNLDN